MCLSATCRHEIGEVCARLLQMMNSRDQCLFQDRPRRHRAALPSRARGGRRKKEQPLRLDAGACFQKALEEPRSQVGQSLEQAICRMKADVDADGIEHLEGCPLRGGELQKLVPRLVSLGPVDRRPDPPAAKVDAAPFEAGIGIVEQPPPDHLEPRIELKLGKPGGHVVAGIVKPDLRLAAEIEKVSEAEETAALSLSQLFSRSA